MTQPAANGASAAATSATVSYIKSRLESCLRIIAATPEKEADQKALLWMLVEEITGLLPRVWRAAR